ncbi:MAG: hypothetical protein V4609_01850 [Pseudomonadota bacterium]
MHRCLVTFRSVAPLGWLGVVLLAMGALAFAPAWQPQLREAALARAQAQAQLIANALALQAGLAGLHGQAGPSGQPAAADAHAWLRADVNKVIARLPSGSPEIVAVALLAPADELLWLHPPNSPRGLPPGPRVFAPVMRDGVPFARVLVVWRPAPLARIVAPWVPPLAVWLLTLALLAGQVLRLAWSRGMLAREAQLRYACQLIDAGDFDWWMLPVRRRAFDDRLARLMADVRNLNEMHRRIRHLGESLRNTELDPARRAEFDLILQEASGSDRFAADQIPPEMSVPAGPPASRRRAVLLAVVLGAGAALPWLAVSGLARDAGLEMLLDAALAVEFFLLAALACVTWWLPRRRPRAAPPHLLDAPRAA